MKEIDDEELRRELIDAIEETAQYIDEISQDLQVKDAAQNIASMCRHGLDIRHEGLMFLIKQLKDKPLS